MPVESHGCWQRGEEIWLAAGKREHLARPAAAGAEQTHWSGQHTAVYEEPWLAKSAASFKNLLLNLLSPTDFGWPDAKPKSVC